MAISPSQTAAPSPATTAHTSAPVHAPPTHTTPLSADDKFLALAGYLLAVPIVYRVSPCGGIIMIAIFVALAYHGGGDRNQR